MPKRKPPSRIRYEQRNPTISCRVPVEFKRDLSQQLRKTGQSFSRWIQASFRGDDPAVAETERAYWRGWEKGADQAISDVSLIMTVSGSDEGARLLDAVMEACERSYEAEDQAEMDLHTEAWIAATDRLTAWLVDRARKEGRTD